MNKSGKKIFIAVFLMGVAGVIITYILGQDYYFGIIYKKSGKKLSLFSEFSSSVCGFGSSVFDCSRVSASNYSRFLEFPLALIGMFYFIVATSLTFLAIQAEDGLRKLISRYLFWLLAFGSVFDIYLLIISIFAVKAICILCLSTYLLNWISLGMLIYYFSRMDINPFKPNKTMKELQKMHKKKLTTRYAPIFLLVAIISAGITYGTKRSLQARRTEFMGGYKKQAIKKIIAEFSQVTPVDVSSSSRLIIGDPDAPVTIVEFSDFLCPFCATTSRIMDSLIDENPGKVKLVFMAYPLDTECNKSLTRQIHPGACRLALGAISSQKQGKFRAYHDLVFKYTIKNPGLKDFKRIASLTGLDLNRFLDDMKDQKTRDELIFHIQRGGELGVRATPTIFINGKIYKYRPVKEVLQTLINIEYNKLKK